MESLKQKTKNLNEMQLHLLRFFGEQNPDVKETEELKRLVAKYYAEKADNEFDKISKNQPMDEKYFNDLLNTSLTE